MKKLRETFFQLARYCFRTAAWLSLCLLGLLPRVAAAAVEVSENLNPQLIVRIGIAPGTWGGVNPNDANAAIVAWAKAILRHRNIIAQVEPQLYDTADALHLALGSGQLDAVSMLTDQFLALDSDLQPQQIFFSTRNGEITEQYVLVVHQSSGLTNVAGLSGHRLLLQSSSRSSLAPYWLETLLARGGLDHASSFLDAIIRVDKPSKAVLAVFFHQADACLVTSNVFELSCELNPQLRRELRVLAVSPPVIPSLFFFRPGYKSIIRDQLEPAILTLHETPAGQQLLTVFQSDGMARRPLGSLDESRRLLADFRLSCPGLEQPLTNLRKIVGVRKEAAN